MRAVGGPGLAACEAGFCTRRQHHAAQAPPPPSSAPCPLRLHRRAPVLVCSSHALRAAALGPCLRLGERHHLAARQRCLAPGRQPRARRALACAGVLLCLCCAASAAPADPLQVRKGPPGPTQTAPLRRPPAPARPAPQPQRAPHREHVRSPPPPQPCGPQDLLAWVSADPRGNAHKVAVGSVAGGPRGLLVRPAPLPPLAVPPSRRPAAPPFSLSLRTARGPLCLHLAPPPAAGGRRRPGRSRPARWPCASPSPSH